MNGQRLVTVILMAAIAMAGCGKRAMEDRAPAQEEGTKVKATEMTDAGDTAPGTAQVREGAEMRQVTAREPGAMVDFETLLPAEVLGWKKEPGKKYAPQELFQYIDGAAEAYIAFNVRDTYAVRYQKPDAPEIMIDIFRMATAADAYGIYFNETREGPTVGIGAHSEFIGGSLYFWKGTYYISVAVFEEMDDARRAVLALGELIAAVIAEEGGAPEVAGRLPVDGRVGRGVQYFHTWQVLNQYYFIADENLLGLTEHTEGALARFAPADAATTGTTATVARDEPTGAVVVRYPSEDAAKAAAEQFLAGYLKGADAQGRVRTEDGRLSALRREGALVALVLGAGDEAELEQLMKSIRLGD